MTPIYTRTLTGIVYTILFNNIPQTFTDLKVVISGRTDANAAFDGGPSLFFNNATTGTNHSQTAITGNGSAATSSRTADIAVYFGDVSAATGTANTFSNTEFYIPNYTSNNFKSLTIDNVAENNTTTAYQNLRAGLWRNSAAITSIGIFGGSGNWVSGSTFSLYGITKG